MPNPVRPSTSSASASVSHEPQEPESTLEPEAITQQAQIAAEKSWTALTSFWSPFPFLLQPGATTEQVDSWQTAQGVTLSPEVRALVAKHTFINLPTGKYGDFSPETTLTPIEQWLRFDRSDLNQEMDDAEYWPDILADSGCPSRAVQDYVIIGSDLWGADYGIFVILHPETNAVFGITQNIPEITPLGTMNSWLAERRLNNLPSASAYKPFCLESGEHESGAVLAEGHRFYLSLDTAGRAAQWEKVQTQFIQAFDSL